MNIESDEVRELLDISTFFEFLILHNGRVRRSIFMQEKKWSGYRWNRLLRKLNKICCLKISTDYRDKIVELG